MKLSLLAKSCLCPGLVALITNLIKSSKEPPEELEERVSGRGQENWRWLFDYWSGKKYEIYRIEIPRSFASQPFNSIAKQVYKQTGFILFALEIVVGENVNGDILLNPGSQRLPKPSNRNGLHIKYTYFGYIIAPDRDEAEAIFSTTNINKQHKQFKKSKVQQVADVGEIEKLHYDPLKVTSTVAINGYVDPASKGHTMKVSEY